ncbi:thiamine phosphate synthase [Imbroritus primus]|uniref:Thiamine phosphate synthase n=1 Tax=Imbroritus primus TaxID=3058603 RepID=A0ACD3SLH3_9BURK|nr:thiamine phosphate synthase [Burkholderiaceae bacterium PBA]
MDLRHALLERHGASFGRGAQGWQITAVDLPAGEVRFRLSAPAHAAADGDTDTTAETPGETTREAVLVTTLNSAGSRRQIVDHVDGPFGAWQFVSSAEHDPVLSEPWLDTVRALLDMDFEPHDAVCLARAWHVGDTTWPTHLPRFPAVTLRAAPLQAPGLFPPCPEQLGLYAVVPDAEWIERLVPLGVPTLQLRFKSGDPARVADEIARAEQAARGSACRLFINDHWQEAIRQHRAALDMHGASGIYGIHLGQEDLADTDLPAICTARLRLGVSTHGFAEMLRVLPLQPSYLALGAVFPTTTKTLKTAPQGLARLQAYVETVRSSYPALPLVAIGGIDAGNAEEVLRTGVGNVAVVRAVTEAGDLSAAVRRLRALAG